MLRHGSFSGFAVNFSTSLLLVLAFVAANLPFLVERVFFVAKPKVGSKTFAWRLLELVVLFFVVGGQRRAVRGVRLSGLRIPPSVAAARGIV